MALRGKRYPIPAPVSLLEAPGQCPFSFSALAFPPLITGAGEQRSEFQVQLPSPFPVFALQRDNPGRLSRGKASQGGASGPPHSYLT